jgi:hypothetical protein
MKTFKKFIGEEVAANAVGANPPDAVKVAGEPFKKVGNSIVTSDVETIKKLEKKKLLLEIKQEKGTIAILCEMY